MLALMALTLLPEPGKLRYYNFDGMLRIAEVGRS
jgi:hypothetical protein